MAELLKSKTVWGGLLLAFGELAGFWSLELGSAMQAFGYALLGIGAKAAILTARDALAAHTGAAEREAAGARDAAMLAAHEANQMHTGIKGAVADATRAVLPGALTTAIKRQFPGAPRSPDEGA